MIEGIVKTVVLAALAGGGYLALRAYQHRLGDPEMSTEARKAIEDRKDAGIIRQVFDHVTAGPRVADVLVVERSGGDLPKMTLLIQERTADESLLPARLMCIDGAKARFTAVLVPLKVPASLSELNAVPANAHVPLLTTVEGEIGSDPKPIDEPGQIPFVFRSADITISEFQKQLWKDLWRSVKNDASLTTVPSDWVPMAPGDVFTLTLPSSGRLSVVLTRHLTSDEVQQLRETARNLTPTTTNAW